LSNHIVSAETVNTFKNRLDKFWSDQEVLYCRVPELIPVLGSQPAGDVSHKPGGRLP